MSNGVGTADVQVTMVYDILIKGFFQINFGIPFSG